MTGFDWMEFSNLAKRLALATDEASQRSAISRFYYCIFNLATVRAESNSYVPSREGTSHRDVWLMYELSPVQECRTLARIGKRTRSQRVSADYDAHYPDLVKALKLVASDAEQFVSILSKLDPRHPKPTIQRR
jgi:uncharacterized protein (UPF0332 family)